MRVLIVEDNPGDRVLLSVMLEDHGYCEIMFVETLAAALVHLCGPASTRPEVVLLDLMLPDSTGLDSLRRIREAAPEVATVVLTAVEDDGLALAAVREGAQDYFTKGRLGPEVLDRCIRHAVERERIRRQVLERESLLRVAYEGISVIPWDLDLDANQFRAGAFMLPHPALGPAGEVSRYLDRVHPADRARLEAEVRGLIAAAGEAKVEYRLRQPDGTFRWQQTVLQARPRYAPPARKLLGVTVDVHRRRMAEDTLRALSQTLARRTGQDFFDGVVLHLNASLGTRWAVVIKLEEDNPLHAHSLAFAEHSYLHPPATYHLDHSPCAQVLSRGQSYIASGLQELFPEYPIPRELCARSYCGTRLVDSRGKNLGVLFVLHDAALPDDGDVIQQTLGICAPRVAAEIERLATQRSLEASEARLHQAQKMEAIGKLASGIAHDFTNLLTAVRGHASLATSMLGPDHPALENLKQLEDAARQASGVASSLLTFARRSRPDLAQVALLPMLESSIALFRGMVPPGVPLDLDLEAAQGLIVNADETQVRQLFINLLLNAADAVAFGGRLSLRVETVSPPDEPVEVAISVCDTGVGIPPEVMPRLFEPFFTTKSKGSGLGLAVAHGVVTEHGWKIDIQSEIGAGSTFRVVAPAQRAVPAEHRPGEPAPWEGRRALVLVRGRLPRALISGALTEMGLSVVQLGENVELPGLHKPEAPRIDLVVMEPDPEAPSPLATWQQLHSRWPEAKCISIGSDVGPGPLPPEVYSIGRPFQLVALKAAIAVLCRPAPNSQGRDGPALQPADHVP